MTLEAAYTSVHFLHSVRGYLPSTFADLARRADENGEEVAKGTQCDEEVEALDSAVGAEDVPEEEGCCYLLGIFKLGSRDLPTLLVSF